MSGIALSPRVAKVLAKVGLITLDTKATGQLQSVDNRGGWWPIIRESYAGAWQQNDEITVANVTTHATVFACVTLKASDVAKMRIRLVQQDANGIWNEVESPSFSPVLRKPNHYQNRIQFYETWVTSKELNGNTYVLKVRDGRRVVIAEYVLDPQRVRPLVAPNGDVYYELKRDDLSKLPQEAYVVPATEVIHDRQNCLFHPLVGLSPIYACGLAAVQGINIQNSSARLFQNGAMPGGVLTAPGAIAQDTADRIKAYWDTNFSGDNAGKVAVLGDGLKYEQMVMKAVDAQLIDQLKWTDVNICTAFKVPPYKVNVGPPPNYNNIEALDVQYYSQGLQILVESIELCQDDGLGLTDGDIASQRYGTEFDTDDLYRMDTATRVKAAADGLNAAMSPNEVRRRYHGLGPVPGGKLPYLQQQYFSLEALAKRDAEDPFAKPAAQQALPAATAEEDEDEDEMDEEAQKMLAMIVRQRLAA